MLRLLVAVVVLWALMTSDLGVADVIGAVARLASHVEVTVE